MGAIRSLRGIGASMAVPVGAAILAFAAQARAEAVPTSHQVAVGLTGVYDAGHDRGLRYGMGYRFSASMFQVEAQLVFGDTDPRNEQHWTVSLGLQPIEELSFAAAFHHRTYARTGFGENLLTFVGCLRWWGAIVDGGIAVRFPIMERDQIHSPFVMDADRLESFVLYRAGYLWEVGHGVSLGLEVGNFSRFELHNFNYPMFAAVATWSHPAVGTVRADLGFGTAGFFSLGSTIDRGFLRVEYVYASL